MTLDNAIRKVCGVSMSDIRSDKHSIDRMYGRAIYSKLSGKKKAELARELGKAYTTITYYLNKYDELWAKEVEFRDLAQQVKSLI